MTHHSTSWTTCDGILFYCRAGFEADCAAEITWRAHALGVPVYCRAQAGKAFLHVHAADPSQLPRLLDALDWRSLIFPRQWLGRLARLEQLPEGQRVEAITAALPPSLRQVSGLVLEYPDTNTGKALSRFCKRFERPLAAGLQSRGVRIVEQDTAPRLHLFFEDSAAVELALADPARSAPWPLGVPRLRMPRGAPSRSTLKLEEALLVLLRAEERDALLRPGATAVDLGASPGGWTWQLVQRGLHVAAIDNGPMDADLMASGLVEHRREDGFRYRPRRPVDLLVCDMVEQPSRIADLMARWLRQGDCRAAAFNLKLPMKQRFRAVQDGLGRLPKADARGAPFTVRCRQLYHDRDEVTVAVLPSLP